MKNLEKGSPLVLEIPLVRKHPRSGTVHDLAASRKLCAGIGP